MAYSVLDKESLESYISQIPRLMEVLGDGNGYDVSEIGDGNLNFVYRVSRTGHPERSIIVKQAVPYLRVAGESWPLDKQRMLFEIKALRAYNDLVPSFVPEIYHADEKMCVLVMEDLGDVKVLRYEMIKAKTFPGVGNDIGQFLAQSLFKTSYLGMQSIERRALMSEFSLNSDLCKLTEEFIFTFPFLDHESNYVNPETNKHALATLRGDPEYLKRVLHFKELFLSKTDALLHADLHTGSLMTGAGKTYVIDMEFAYFGPFGFDVGKIIANFLMSYTSHFARPGGIAYQDWILSECAQIWKTFEQEFLALWKAQTDSALLFENMLIGETLEQYQADFMRQILSDTVGFAACCLARRTVGIAGVADIRDIEDVETRTTLEKMNIDLSHRLMMKHETFSCFDEIVNEIKAFYAEQNTKILDEEYVR